MCIIIDTNTFNSVFDLTANNHQDFKPVFDWIISGDGKVVYGGTKYTQELVKAEKFRKLFIQLKNARKVVIIQEAKVDQYQATLEEALQHRNFDDPHLIAIAYISKCKLICSLDKRAYRFLNRKEFYPNNSPRPKIYSSRKNINLLSKENIAPICEPCIRLKKSQAATLI